jgi:hypothetical protein
VRALSSGLPFLGLTAELLAGARERLEQDVKQVFPQYYPEE